MNTCSLTAIEFFNYTKNMYEYLKNEFFSNSKGA